MLMIERLKMLMRFFFISSVLFLSCISCQENASEKIVRRFNLNNLPEKILVCADSLFKPSSLFTTGSDVTYTLCNEDGDTLISEFMKPERLLSDMSYVLYAKHKGQTKRIFMVCYAYHLVSAIEYRILDSVKFDKACFTQGFYIENGSLIYTCGQYGQSRIVVSELLSAKPLSETWFAKEIFVEGVDGFKHGYFCLTWKENIALLLDKALNVVDTLNLPGAVKEGWGVLTDADRIFVSDGTSSLKELALVNDELQLKSEITVHNNGQPVDRINELARLNDSLFAFNRWYDNQIYIARLKGGLVVGKIDLNTDAHRHEKAGVLNGIHVIGDTLYFTGKNWPYYYKAWINLSNDI